MPQGSQSEAGVLIGVGPGLWSATSENSVKAKFAEFLFHALG